MVMKAWTRALLADTERDRRPSALGILTWIPLLGQRGEQVAKGGTKKKSRSCQQECIFAAKPGRRKREVQKPNVARERRQKRRAKIVLIQYSSLRSLFIINERQQRKEKVFKIVATNRNN